MDKISVKITGTDKAMADYIWCEKKKDWRGYLMVDCATGEVWCDCCHESEWKRYKQPSIVDMPMSDYMRDHEHITEYDIIDCAKKLIAQWEATSMSKKYDKANMSVD